MKCTIPEISWHNRDPVLSVDVQPKSTSENLERLATGGTDSHVLIWHIEVLDTGAVKVEFAADLQRHQKAVNVVRFSPSGEFLASGDDESAIIIWKQKTDQDAPELPTGDNDIATKEQWLGIKVLRGHVEDVYDLSWSPDSNNLISGSVDNSAIIWDVHKGRSLSILKDHKSFVQGVTWDPNNQFVATLSSDRTCRVYNVNSKKLVNRVSKAQLPVPESSDLHGKIVRLFHDDTLKSFFRRLSFTPDGQLLIVPSGIVENSSSDKNSNATHIFTRHMFNRPAAYLPSNNQYTVAVRCCPLLFELREREPMFALPYRMILAVATQNSVLLYDTQQSEPFGIVSNIHYTRLTDVTWSSNGRILIVSSTDGYCSIITFAEGELGVVYEPKKSTVNESVEDCEMSQYKNKSPEKDSEEKEDNVDSHLIKNISNDVSNECKLDYTAALQRKQELSSENNVKSNCNQSQNEENKEVTELCNRHNVSKDNSPNSNKVSTTPVQVKTPRRIKPIMLSVPHKKTNKEKGSPDRKNVSSSVTTPRKIQPTSISEPNEKNTESKKESNSNAMASSSDKIDKTKEAIGSIVDEDGDKTNIPSKNTSPEESCSMDFEEVTAPEVNLESTSDELTLNEPKKDGDSSNSKTGILPKKVGDSKNSVMEVMEIENDKESTGMSKEKIIGDSPPVSPMPHCITPGREKRTPRRVQFITLSSPKSKKKLL